MAEELERKRRGFWLRMARERAGLSQATVAKELGLSGASKGTLSAWEAGTREPTPTKLAQMLRIYGVSAAIVMDPEPTAYERLDERMGAQPGRVDVEMPDGTTIESKAIAEQQPTRRRAWWLRDLREKRGLTQGQVAQRLGTSTRTILIWEEGRGEPTIRQESTLAELLDAPIRRPSAEPAQERRRRSA